MNYIQGMTSYNIDIPSLLQKHTNTQHEETKKEKRESQLEEEEEEGRKEGNMYMTNRTLA